MVIDSKSFKEACQTILFAIDNKDVSLLTETLELFCDGDTLELRVTNREYYIVKKFTLSESHKLKASVNAKIFLSLISKITTDTVELNTQGNTLKVKANGEYTLPMIYNNDTMLELPTIDLGTITNTMSIGGSILLSILNNNSKELQRGLPAQPVQKYYYIDEQGAITFTSGACVNSFTLEKPVKMLLSDKVVKLFKLFRDENNVLFNMGQNQLSDDLIQTVVQFSTNDIILTAKMASSDLFNSVPVTAIRTMSQKLYPHSMVIDRNLLLQSLNRIMIFNDDSRTYGNLEINGNVLKIQDFNGGSTESITSNSESSNINNYKLILDLKNLKLMIDGCSEQYITMCFGDSKAVVIKKQNVSDIIPEIKIS